MANSLEFSGGVYKDPTAPANMTELEDVTGEPEPGSTSDSIDLQSAAPEVSRAYPYSAFPDDRTFNLTTLGTASVARLDDRKIAAGDGSRLLTEVQKDNVVYHSYAGTDIVATLVLPNEAPMTLGELQTISYSIHRENTPVRFLGHVNPVAFIKGPRTIAGSLIFTVFNYYAFNRLKQFQAAATQGVYPTSDMLPPFDVVVTFANELGVMSKMRIFGVTIVDEGGTMSVDDLITEQTYSYMARGIQPMTGYSPRNL